MYFAAHFDGRCASLRTDDMDGIRFLYPASSGGLQIVTDSSLASGTVGAVYTQALAAAGEAGPYSWTISPLKGQLPPGLALSPTGVITGTPLIAGTFGFSAQVIDSSMHAAQRAFSITITPGLLEVVTASLKPGVKGASFSQQLTAAGGLPPYRWALASGQLPAGLGLDSATGVLSGTPSATGRFSISVSVSDAAAGTAVRPLEILVVDQDSVPQISSVKYKTPAGKLIVRGIRFDSGATLMIDGSVVRTIFQSEEAVLSKGLLLASGTHQVVVIDSNGVASSPFSLTLN